MGGGVIPWRFGQNFKGTKFDQNQFNHVGYRPIALHGK